MNPCRLLIASVVWWLFNKNIFLKKCLPCVFFVMGLWVVVVVKGGWVYW